MLHFSTLRKYTLALLSTFNDIEIEYKLSDNTITNRKIPIKYSSREKAKMFDEHTTKQLLSGNTNVLPRIALSMSSMIKSEMRATNKFVKINTNENGDIKEYQYNGVPFDLSYELSIQCRGMNEAGMIVEQIVTRFNPNYTIRINEVPNQTEPTSVPVQLLDIALSTEEYEEISTNIVTIDVGLMLKGTFYPPIKSLGKIKTVDIFMNNWYHSNDNDYNRAALYEYDVVGGITQVPVKHNLVGVDGQFTKIVPVITDIFSPNSVLVGENIQLEVIYNDWDNKDTELTYVWTVTGSSTITNGLREITLSGVATEVIDVSCTITDIHGNSSNTFIKQITVV